MRSSGLSHNQQLSGSEARIFVSLFAIGQSKQKEKQFFIFVEL